MEEPVVLHPYNPAWPVLFDREQSAIAAALGLSHASILHVGSTAVPGLSAKPIIDVLIESPVYPPDPAMIAALAGLDYEHMGECGVAGRHWFRKGRPRSHHVHLVPTGGDVGRRQIALRDWLRTHPDDARTYERVKRAAAAGQAIDSDAYAAAKSELIARILARPQQT